MKQSKEEFLAFIKQKFNAYAEQTKAKEWHNNNYERVKLFFANYSLRDFIFEPFKSVFDSSASKMDKDIYSVITQVAIVNAVLAGLPGKLGIGVGVSALGAIIVATTDSSNDNAQSQGYYFVMAGSLTALVGLFIK